SHQRVGERLCNTLESGRPWREALLVRAKVISVEFPRRSDHLVHGRDLIDQTDRFGLVAGPDLATTVVNISLEQRATGHFQVGDEYRPALVDESLGLLVGLLGHREK